MGKSGLRFVICSCSRKVCAAVLRCVMDGDRNRHRNLGSLRNICGAVIQAQEGFLSFGCRQMKFHRKKSHEDPTEMIWFNA